MNTVDNNPDAATAASIPAQRDSEDKRCDTGDLMRDLLVVATEIRDLLRAMRV